MFNKIKNIASFWGRSKPLTPHCLFVMTFIKFFQKWLLNLRLIKNNKDPKFQIFLEIYRKIQNFVNIVGSLPRTPRLSETFYFSKIFGKIFALPPPPKPESVYATAIFIFLSLQ